MRCPHCSNHKMMHLLLKEEFDFDIGGRILHVVAERVPVEWCSVCGETLSGHEAAKVREKAIDQAANGIDWRNCPKRVCPWCGDTKRICEHRCYECDKIVQNSTCSNGRCEVCCDRMCEQEKQ